MATRLVVLSDTHLPVRAKDLPPALWAAIDDAHVVIHAGDWVSVDLLDRIAARTPHLVGVVGNNDHGELRDRLPEVARIDLEGLRFAVVHETGPATGRERRMDAAYPSTDVLVFGHSHIPWDTVTAGGMRLLNPGSPTDRRREPTGTFLTALAEGGELRELELIRV